MKKSLLSSFLILCTLCSTGFSSALPISAIGPSKDSSIESTAAETQAVEPWDGTTAASVTETDGNTYNIENGADLAWVAKQVNDGTNDFNGKTITLTSDIDLGNREWTPIGGNGTGKIFRGIVNGNNKTISNFQITQATGRGVGLFGTIDSATSAISNLTLSGPITVTADVDDVAVLVGKGVRVSLTNVDVTASEENPIKITGKRLVGTLVGGSLEKDITGTDITVGSNSFVKAISTDEKNRVGGVVGQSEWGVNYSNITSNIPVIGVFDAGGVLGLARCKGKLTNVVCSAPVTITGTTNGDSTVDLDNTNTSWAYTIGGLIGSWNNQDQNETLTIGSDCNYTYTGGLNNSNTSLSQWPFDKQSLIGNPRYTPDPTSQKDKDPKYGAGTLTIGSNQQVAYSGNTYYSSLTDAIAKCPTGGTIYLLADVSSATSLTKPINIVSNGYKTEQITIPESAQSYLQFYKSRDAESPGSNTNDNTSNIFVTYQNISISPASTSQYTGNSVALTATVTCGEQSIANPQLVWEISPEGASFNPAGPTGSSATITSSIAGTYTVTAKQAVNPLASLTLTAQGTSTVNYSVYTRPPVQPTPDTKPEEQPPVQQPETPSDTPVTDSGDNSADFAPDSGTNAGVTGTGAGFDSNGSQTIQNTTNNTSTTFTQNTDGSKAATTQNSSGEVTNSVITVPNSAINNNAANVSLGTNSNGTQLTIPGNKESEAAAPSVTINLPSAATEAKVTVPIEEGTLEPGTVAMIKNEDGTLVPIVKTTFDDDNSTLTIPLTGSQKVVIVNNAISFPDSSNVEAYAREAAAFTSSRLLMTGVGDTTPKPFDYAGLTSRGQFATIMYRLEGEPSVSGAYPEGIIPGAWNADAARWMVQNGYMAQGGSLFNPQQDITRNQIIAIVYRMNGSGSANLSVLDKYADADQIPSTDFRNAMAWGVEKGIIGQGTDLLEPEDDASRAEIAAMIQRIIEVLS